MSAFHPADWVARADAINFDVKYVCGWEGRGGQWHPRNSLWFDYGGVTELAEQSRLEVELNRADGNPALIDHLKNMGRVVVLPKPE